MNLRARKAYEAVVQPMVGLDFERFRIGNMPLPTYMEKQGGMYQNMSIQSMQFNLGTDFLIAGLDVSGAHLSHVTPRFFVPIGKAGACRYRERREPRNASAFP